MIRRNNFKRENLEKKRNEKFLVHTVGSNKKVPDQGSAPGILTLGLRLERSIHENTRIWFLTQDNLYAWKL